MSRDDIMNKIPLYVNGNYCRITSKYLKEEEEEKIRKKQIEQYQKASQNLERSRANYKNKSHLVINGE